jgi:ABC-type dipeptide/oligopeptide/nickel transport system permease component
MENVYTYKSNWWGFIGKRVLIAVLVFFLFTFFVYFFAVNYPFYPEKGLRFIITEYTTQEQRAFIQELNQKYHFLDPYMVQYFYWLGDFFEGNWGYPSQSYPWLTQSK